MMVTLEMFVTALSASVTLVIIAFFVFPSNIVEVFSGAAIILVLILEKSDRHFKIKKMEKTKNEE